MRRGTLFAGIGVGLLLAIYAAVLFIADSQLTRMLPGAVASAVGGRDAHRYTVRAGNLINLVRNVTVTAVDNAGNVGASADTSNITVDNGPEECLRGLATAGPSGRAEILTL